MSERTNRSTLKLMATSILNKLENRKFIDVDTGKRNTLQDEFTAYLSRWVMTDEDFTERVRKEISDRSEALADQNITETSAFQSRKKQLKEQLGEHELHGFYFQVPVREVVLRVSPYLLSSKHVEEVFESDEAIQKLVMDAIQTFDVNKIST